MTNQFPPAGSPTWRELLSIDETRAWVNKEQKPDRLTTEFAVPGVYRFIFPEDENGRTLFYVGEAGCVADRLCQHFRKQRGDDSDPPGPAWRLRGRIQLSQGNFHLDYLSVDGKINLFGVEITQDSLTNTFVRRLLENWALLCPIPYPGSEVLNYGPNQQLRGILRRLKFRKRVRSTNGAYVDPQQEVDRMRHEEGARQRT